MLAAMINASLADDVFREDKTSLEFESYVASLTGQEDGCFTVTGTMANQLALRSSLMQPPHAILGDARAHVFRSEAGGPAFMSGAMIQPVMPANGRYLTLDDIQAAAVLSDNVDEVPTRLITLENTISGIVVPLSELQRITSWARQRGIATHLDGARLFEAVATGAASLKQYCEPFDTVSLDFSKNLGAPIGAMMLSSKVRVAAARRIRKSVGGGLRQAGVLSALARATLDEQFGDVSNDKASKLRETHRRTKEVASLWEQCGGKLIRKVETNIAWLNLQAAECSAEDFNKVGDDHGFRVDGQRLVLHHQTSNDAIRRLRLAFEDVFGAKSRRATKL